MKNKIWIALVATAGFTLAVHAAEMPKLTLSPNETLEMQGLSVIVEQNYFSPISLMRRMRAFRSSCMANGSPPMASYA